MKKIIFLLLIVSITFSARKDDLQKNIAQMKEKLNKEKNFFSDYEGRRENLINSKEKEKKRLEKDLRKSRADLIRLKTEIKRSEIAIKNDSLESDEIKKQFRAIAVKLKENILSGIPFDQQRRASILTSIISDIDAGVGSPVELLNRLVAFFDAEDVYSYDSQTFSAIVPIKGKESNVSVLRVGRVLFFVDDGKNVYSYIRSKGGEYSVADKNPLSIQDKKVVRDAIKMLNGQKPLDVVNLKISLKNYSMSSDKNKKSKK